MNGKKDTTDTPRQGHPQVPVAQVSKWPRFSLWAILATTMTICLLFAVLVPSIRHRLRLEQQMRCTNNMKQIILSLHNYHDIFKSFPPAVTYAQDGTPMHSWRLLINPFMGQPNVFDQYDLREPWDAPKNRLLGDAIPDRVLDSQMKPHEFVYDPCNYRCPSAPSSQDRMCTNYVMVIDDRPGQPNAPPTLPGSVPPQMLPGSSVIIIEIADSDIHWMEPSDVLLSELSMKINDRTRRSLSSFHGGACVAKADGSVIALDESMTADYVKKLLSQ